MPKDHFIKIESMDPDNTEPVKSLLQPERNPQYIGFDRNTYNNWEAVQEANAIWLNDAEKSTLSPEELARLAKVEDRIKNKRLGELREMLQVYQNTSRGAGN